MASLSKKRPPGKGDNKRLVTIAKDIKKLEKGVISDVIKIGELLHEAAQACDHGEYQNWLRREFNWSLQTALNYRNVYEFDANPPPQKPNGWVFGDVYELNISQSALYLIAGMKRGDQQPARLAVIAAAKVGRVTFSMAKQIIASLTPPVSSLGSEKAPFVELALDSDDDDRTPGAAAKPVEPHHATLDHVKSVIADKVEQRKEAAREKAPASAAEVTAKPEPEYEYDDIAASLRRLWRGMKQSYDAHDSGVNLENAIVEVGAGSTRDIINWLRNGLDKHSDKTAVATKADRAEAGRKNKLNKTTIQAMADAAEPESVKATALPDAFPCPDIPPFLDRRQTAEIDDDLGIPPFLRRSVH